MDIPIRPITLLFGANSAGKSTILQALLYLRHVLENSEPSQVNVDKLEVSGETIDLGGFDQFVKDQDLDNQIHIAVTVTVDDDGLPSSSARLKEKSMRIRHLKDVNEVSVGVTISRYNEAVEWCCVDLYEVKINGEYIAKIEAVDSPENCEVSINVLHPAFAGESEGGEDVHPLVEYWLNMDLDEEHTLHVGQDWFCVPKWGRSFGDSYGNFEHFYDNWDMQDDDFEQFVENGFVEANHYLTQLLVGSGELVLKELKGMRNIGGLREIPDRMYKPGIKERSEKWYKGKAAWDRFQGDNHEVSDLSLMP